MSNSLQELEKKIIKLVREYGEEKYSENSFEPGVSHVPVSGKLLSSYELELMTSAVLDGWLTAGRFNSEFEKQLSNITGSKFSLSTNSGSSANLLAISALTSPLLNDRKLYPGDEIITVAAGFPTTINPIIQNNLIPVFVDIDINYLNIDVKLIEDAITEKTKAIFVAHTLGNPFDEIEISKIAKKHNLWLIEDCCDALGAKVNNKMVGSLGDIGTFSFYPAHHITMGEGGAVFTNNAKLKKILESFRDWGRDCYCAPGCDNTCKRRFEWQLGSLPFGYDHKYIYSHCGYNLKITDIQAACGLAQLKRIDEFINKRVSNYSYLLENLCDLDNFLFFPKAIKSASPSWFGFPVILKNDQAGAREKLLSYLDSKNIGTRLIFAGNVIKQPYFNNDIKYRISGTLENTDKIMNKAFWLGLFPGLSVDMLDYVIISIKEYFHRQ
jgi:CDP-4-dehydro-6-deoxyglucose reductase, E1